MKTGAKKRCGRPRKYALNHLSVGEKTYIQFERQGPDTLVGSRKVRNAIDQEQRRTGKEFKWWYAFDGIWVERLK